MGRLYLVRHAQASLMSDDYDRLSSTGVEQSRRLGAWFAACGVSFDDAWCGTLRRQRHTATDCLDAMGSILRPTVDPAFDEYRDDELFAGLPAGDDTHAALIARAKASDDPRRAFQALVSDAFEGWVRGDAEVDAATGRRSWTTFRAGVMGGVTRAAAACGSGRNALVVSSGGAITAACQALLGIPDDRIAALHWVIHNASITRLLCRPGRVTLASFNSVEPFEDAAHRHLITYR